jgi:MFS family permease
MRGRRSAGWVPPFIAGRGLSAIGSQVTFLCLPAAVVLVPGATAATVAVLEGMTVVGFVLVALPAGVLADRLPPRALLLVCDVGRAVALVTAALALTTAAHRPVAGLVLAAVAIALASVLTTQNDASTQRLIVGSADRKSRAVLNSWMQGLSSAAALAGPAVAGVLIAAGGPAHGLMVDGGSFLIAAITLLWCWRLLRLPAPKVAESPTVGQAVSLAAARQRRDALAGFRVILSHRDLAAATFSITLANLFSGIYGASWVVFALRVQHLGGGGLAALGIATALGGSAGAAAAGRTLRRWGPAAVLTWAPFGYVALALVAVAPPGGLFEPLIGVTIYAAAVALASISYVTLRQDAAPAEVAGRVAAASRALTSGVYPASAAIAVGLLTVLPVHTVIWIAVLGESASILVMLLARRGRLSRRSRREIGETEPSVESESPVQQKS